MAEYVFYTSSFDHVIQVNLFDSEKRSIRNCAEIEVPFGTYLTLNRRGNRLYVGSEVFGGEGAVTVFDASDPVRLKELGRVGTGDQGPAYLALSNDERFLMGCSYFSGTVCVYALDEEGIPGKETWKEQRTTCGTAFPPGSFGQAVPRCHCIRQMPGSDYVFVTDYSGDRLLVYGLTDQGELKWLTEYRTKVGEAPRHVEWNPVYPGMLYLNTEFSGRVYALFFDCHGERLVETDCFQSGEKEAAMCANLRTSPDGRFLYNTGRKRECIEVFELKEQGRKLCHVGDIPDRGYVRDFIIDPEGRSMLTGNQTENKIQMLHVNRENGMCAPLWNELEAKSPASFAFQRMPYRE